jgi:L-serine dehydratase, iron-sulfur-dependent, beta subunit
MWYNERDDTLKGVPAMLDIFEILGPVMIGPSSSHTAGAAKIGAMARTLLGAPPVKAAIHLYGSFAETGAGHGTDRALVGGLLGMKPDDPRLPDAFAEAEKAGLTYTIDEIKLRDAHPNTAVIEAKSADGRTLTMQASSIGGGRIMVNKLDGIDVNFNGMFNTLVIRNQDASGTVAAITSILSQLRVNVANMSLYRHKRGGDALMVIELDQHLKPSQVAFLSELPGVLSMTYYDKEEDDDGSGFDEGNI